MANVTGLHGLGDDAIKTEDVNIDYSETFSLYIIGSCIGVKSSWKLHFYVEVNGGRKRYEKFANAKTRRIERLSRVLGIDSLEEVL